MRVRHDLRRDLDLVSAPLTRLPSRFAIFASTLLFGRLNKLARLGTGSPASWLVVPP
jgi:hypothetical protein